MGESEYQRNTNGFILNGSEGKNFERRQVLQRLSKIGVSMVEARWFIVMSGIRVRGRGPFTGETKLLLATALYYERMLKEFGALCRTNFATVADLRNYIGERGGVMNFIQCVGEEGVKNALLYDGDQEASFTSEELGKIVVWNKSLMYEYLNPFHRSSRVQIEFVSGALCRQEYGNVLAFVDMSSGIGGLTIGMIESSKPRIVGVGAYCLFEQLITALRIKQINFEDINSTVMYVDFDYCKTVSALLEWTYSQLVQVLGLEGIKRCRVELIVTGNTADLIKIRAFLEDPFWVLRHVQYALMRSRLANTGIEGRIRISDLQTLQQNHRLVDEMRLPSGVTAFHIRFGKDDGNSQYRVVIVAPFCLQTFPTGEKLNKLLSELEYFSSKLRSD